MLMFLVWELLLGIIDPVYKMKVEIIFQIFQMFDVLGKEYVSILDSFIDM